MWQLDTMFGPFLKNGPARTQTKLIAFIDDASRVITHGEFFFFSENTDNLITALRSAFCKRGLPQTLYVDSRADRSVSDNGVSVSRERIAFNCGMYVFSSASPAINLTRAVTPGTSTADKSKIAQTASKIMPIRIVVIMSKSSLLAPRQACLSKV
jgi:hypothetical protein